MLRTRICSTESVANCTVADRTAIPNRSHPCVGSVKTMDILPVHRANTPHRSWGTNCDAWELLDLDDLRIVEERMPPNTHEERHHHSRARQFFYVLRGVLTIELDGQEHTVSAGSGLHVPAGATHLVANRAQEVAVFLAIASPTTAGDRHSE
jgi:mannose-6-phosphate isomerase-like protein (cupin superfamily)